MELKGYPVNPYTYKELVRSRELTALARSIYQALVNRVTDDSLPCRVEAFSKEWYARRYLSHDKPEPVALAYGS